MVDKVNLGCGLDAVDGWLNLDRSPSVLLSRLGPLKRVLRRVGVLADAHMVEWPTSVVRHDVQKGLPVADGSVEAIYTSHMLEHLPLPVVRDVLRECRRALRPGGVIRIALPDAVAIARRFVEGPGSAEAAQSFVESLCVVDNRPIWRRWADGHVHRWQPTVPAVIEMLTNAGFTEPRQCEFRVGDLPDLAAVENRKESFFVEAVG